MPEPYIRITGQRGKQLAFFSQLKPTDMYTNDPGIKTEDEATVNELPADSNGGGDGTDNAPATDLAAAEQ